MIKIGKTLSYDGGKYRVIDVREATAALQRVDSNEPTKWVSLNAIDPSAPK